MGRSFSVPKDRYALRILGVIDYARLFRKAACRFTDVSTCPDLLAQILWWEIEELRAFANLYIMRTRT